MELASPIFPSLFLTLACLGSIARAITGEATTCFALAVAALFCLVSVYAVRGIVITDILSNLSSQCFLFSLVGDGVSCASASSAANIAQHKE